MYMSSNFLCTTIRFPHDVFTVSENQSQTQKGYSHYHFSNLDNYLLSRSPHSRRKLSVLGVLPESSPSLLMASTPKRIWIKLVSCGRVADYRNCILIRWLCFTEQKQRCTSKKKTTLEMKCVFPRNMVYKKK